MISREVTKPPRASSSSTMSSAVTSIPLKSAMYSETQMFPRPKAPLLRMFTPLEEKSSVTPAREPMTSSMKTLK